MARTTSLDIITIIQENAELCTLGTNPQTYPTFLSMEQWQANAEDDTPLPFIYLSRPITNPIKLNKAGTKYRRFRLEILFAGAKLEVDAKASVYNATLAAMRLLLSQFIDQLLIDTRVQIEGEPEESEALGLADRSAYGMLLKINLIVVNNTGLVCS